MAGIIDFFIEYAPLIYILLGLGLVLGLRQFARGRAAGHEAIYGLEREIAHGKIVQGVTVCILMVFGALAEMVLVVFLGPNLPASLRLETPTFNPLTTSTSTLSAETLQALGIATSSQPTQTLQAVGCIPGQIAITAPKAGEEIKGRVTILGTANIPNFGFYKYEFAPAGGANWSTIQANRSVVQDGSLGSWDTSSITPGDYQLRLVVTDNQGNELPACVIPVRVKAP
jgi:hypothetical protein